MKKFIFTLALSATLVSCGAIYSGNGGNSGGYGNTTSSVPADPNTASPETTQEFNELIKTYKPDTQEVLTILLNDNTNEPNTAVVVENASPCNMVFTIKGTNFIKKIPIEPGKTKGAVVKKDTYRLSAEVCRATYDEVKYVTTPYTIKLNNK